MGERNEDAASGVGDANALGRLIALRKSGAELFNRDGADLGFALLDFWQWSVSDLVSNTTRGRLAEYIVARALGIPTDGVRDEWATFDLQTPSGIKVEVKSAAFVQSWHQRKLSAISFMTPLTRAWDPDTNQQSRDARRHADVYVFALLTHRDKRAIDPLNIAQWEFFVVPRKVLDARKRSQHSITLKSLRELAMAVSYQHLWTAVEQAAAGA